VKQGTAQEPLPFGLAWQNHASRYTTSTLSTAFLLILRRVGVGARLFPPCCPSSPPGYNLSDIPSLCLTPPLWKVYSCIPSGIAPDPIRIVLDKAATVEGTTRRGGKRARAWIYAIPEQPDARLFQPIPSEPDGTFHIQGLAPVSYLFFATDVEISLDIHDPGV
jgi:hypothetical protein